jgi:hypothetical protein
MSHPSHLDRIYQLSLAVQHRCLSSDEMRLLHHPRLTRAFTSCIRLCGKHNM